MSANFAGAFLGIVVTFGTTAVIDMHARKSMARRAELIAIAHIDNDIMQLEAICEEMQETDSLYRFVYERHPDRLAEISRDTIDLLLSSMMLPQLLLSNQSAEKAFSNSMETWHDFNDLNLLYSINTCFSLKNTISDLYETVAAYHTEACDSTFEQFERQKKRDDKPTALVRVHLDNPATKAYLRIHRMHTLLLPELTALLKEENNANKEKTGITDNELQRLFPDIYDDEDDEDEYEERRSPLIPILFAVGTAFVIATVFLVMTIVFKNLNVTPEQVGSVAGISSGSTVSVNDSNEYLMPNLIGMSWDEAKSKYSQYMTLVPEQEWSEVTKDQIFDQEYPEGRKVKIGTEVTVKVSMGIRQIEVQDLENLSAAIAESKLQKDGFKVKKTFEESDDIAKDYVIRTEPGAHEMADQGSTVVLVISMGPEDTSVNVPKFVNLPLSVALERAAEYHLDPQVRYEDSEDVEKDVVMEQSIDPGSMVDRDTPIELVVSTGEISEKTRKFTYSLPKKASGEFEFRYYVDGVLDEESKVTLDIGLASSKSMTYTVTGKAGETRTVTIKVTSLDTGKTGSYGEIIVNFPEDGSKATLEDSFDGSIFAELQKADAGSEPTVDTTEPENPGDTSDAGHSEPENTTSSSHTETTPVEPDPGISVD